MNPKKKAAPKGLRILVANDDGINAPGLKVLERIARALSDDVWIVAPEVEQSGAAHALTLHEPLRLRKISSRRYAVRGTPTDAVVMGINQVITGRKPDLVLSGVNRGGNLAEDVTYSGTVAAAMEGALLGLPAIALSQAYRLPDPVHWSTAESHAPDLIRTLVKTGWPQDVLININFPPVAADKVTGTEVTVQGRRDIGSIILHTREDPRGNPYYWLGFRRQAGTPGEHSDLAAMARGAISVTPLKVDLTHEPTLRTLRKVLP